MSNRVAIEVQNADKVDFFLSPTAKTALTIATRPRHTGDGMFAIREKEYDSGRAHVHPNYIVYVDEVSP